MRVGLACVLWISGGIAPVLAADVDPAALQRAIEATAEKYTQAYAQRDARAIGALFTAEAEYVDADGVIFHGREAIVAECEAGFAARPPGKIEIEILSIRPVTSNVVVEDGVSTFRAEGSDAQSQARYTATHVQQTDGGWLLASVRELSSAELSPHDRLLSLAWLIGKWQQDSDGSIVKTHWDWSPDGNFLISEFTTRTPEGSHLSGTHRIGWDAERKQFRSWLFSASGGAADGWWIPGEDGTWSVDVTGVDETGHRMSATITYIRDGADAMAISMSRRVLGGEPLPGYASRVVREPPAPGKMQASR